MQRVSLAIASMFVLTLIATAQEQKVAVPSLRAELINDVDQAKTATHAATSIMESSTAILIDVDISKINVADTLKVLAAISGDPDLANNANDAAMAQASIESLKSAGVEHIYIAASPGSVVDGGPLVAIPCTNSNIVNGLATMIAKSTPDEFKQKVHLSDSMVLIGAVPAIDRVVARSEKVMRPDLILPLTREDRLDHAIVVSLADETRNELVELWPDNMPKSSPIKLSPRQMVADVNRIVVSFSLPPKPQVSARFETTNAEAVSRVKGLLDDLLAIAPQAKSSIEVSIDQHSVTVESSAEQLAKVMAIASMPARKNATRVQRQNTLKQLGLAMHNYYSNEKHLPPRCLTNPDGDELLSWRVVLLPFMEQAALHQQIKMDKAWDDEDNQQMTSVAIPVLMHNEQTPTMTTFRVPVFPGSLWHGDGKPKTFRDVIDGTAFTIAAIDAPVEAAVEWANPQPWIISKDDPMSDIFGDRDQVNVLMLDGSAHLLEREGMTNEKLKALLTYAGRESIEF